MWIVLFILTAV